MLSKEDLEEAKKLSDEHWIWFEKVVGHVAKDFFIHGYKHGNERKRKRQHTTRG